MASSKDEQNIELLKSSKTSNETKHDILKKVSTRIGKAIKENDAEQIKMLYDLYGKFHLKTNIAQRKSLVNNKEMAEVIIEKSLEYEGIYILFDLIRASHPIQFTNPEFYLDLFKIAVDKIDDIKAIPSSIKNDSELLITALYYLNIEAANYLIDNGFSTRNALCGITNKPKYGNPKAKASVKEIINIAMKLIEKGENVNSRCSSDKTPLMNAAGDTFEQYINLLLKHGADPNLIDIKDRNALHFLFNNNRAKSNLKTFVKLFYEGADIEKVCRKNVTSKNTTPLHELMFFLLEINKPILDLVNETGASDLPGFENLLNITKMAKNREAKFTYSKYGEVYDNESDLLKGFENLDDNLIDRTIKQFCNKNLPFVENVFRSRYTLPHGEHIVELFRKHSCNDFFLLMLVLEDTYQLPGLDSEKYDKETLIREEALGFTNSLCEKYKGELSDNIFDNLMLMLKYGDRSNFIYNYDININEENYKNLFFKAIELENKDIVRFMLKFLPDMKDYEEFFSSALIKSAETNYEELFDCIFHYFLDFSGRGLKFDSNIGDEILDYVGDCEEKGNFIELHPSETIYESCNIKYEINKPKDKFYLSDNNLLESIFKNMTVGLKLLNSNVIDPDALLNFAKDCNLDSQSISFLFLLDLYLRRYHKESNFSNLFCNESETEESLKSKIESLSNIFYTFGDEFFESVTLDDDNIEIDELLAIENASLMLKNKKQKSKYDRFLIPLLTIDFWDVYFLDVAANFYPLINQIYIKNLDISNFNFVKAKKINDNQNINISTVVGVHESKYNNEYRDEYRYLKCLQSDYSKSRLEKIHEDFLRAARSNCNNMIGRQNVYLLESLWKEFLNTQRAEFYTSIHNEMFDIAYEGNLKKFSSLFEKIENNNLDFALKKYHNLIHGYGIKAINFQY